MANHVRQRLREAIATAVTGLTTTGARVYQSRVYPTANAQLPGLLVYTSERGNETSQPITLAGPRTLERTLAVMVEARARQTADLDDRLDTVCKEVEAALAADITRGGLCHDCYLSGTTVQLSGDGDQPIGAALMEWTVRYYTTETAPDVAL